MIEEKNVRNIFISYIPSFITGFFGGLFVIFAPYFISSIGNMTEGFFNGFLKVFPWFEKLVMANSFLLFIVYIVGVGLTSVVAKIFGKHFLDKKIDRKSNTYWSDLNIKKKSIKECYRQF